ncbi:MAG: class I SAM-dependent methyltransferase [Thermoanaerobaculum sp.]
MREGRRASARLLFAPVSRRKVEEEIRRQLAELPAFRALVRGVEAVLLQRFALPPPVLDLGCGDGHFGAMALAAARPLGADPALATLTEARQRGVYGLLVAADGERLPLASNSLGTVVANSVLEHIPPVEGVLSEVARVLRPGGLFLLTVPGPGFSRFLSVARLLDGLHGHALAQAYRRAFNAVSRHVHVDPPEVWEDRLQGAGFRVFERTSYIPPAALAFVEWGHVAGFPLYLNKKVFGRFRLFRWAWKEKLLARVLAGLAAREAVEGSYFFFAAKKTPPKAGKMAP